MYKDSTKKNQHRKDKLTMKTCGFCASEINDNYCDFCQMELEDRYIMLDGKRLGQPKKFIGYPNTSEIFKRTSELMALETIDLLCLLREARTFRAEVYKLRLLRHKAEEQSGMTENIQKIEEQSYSEYEQATRKVWVIENIIKDRLGYFPEKVTNNFLNMYIERMQKSDKKVMKLRNSIKKKTV